jgi:predicted transcriptional regulator
MGTEHRPRPQYPRSLDTFASDDDLALGYVKSHGRKVKDVMTAEVIAVTETAEPAEVAMLLEMKRIKRVPVLRDGKLVGIISRANLVRVLAVTASEPETGVDNDDRAIRDRLLAELKGQGWYKAQKWFKIWAPDIIVRDGVVHLWICADQSEEERRALRVAAENIVGVRRVEAHLVPTP